MKNALILLSLPLFLMACRPGIEEAKLAQVDSLQTVLGSSQQIVNAMDSAKMMDYASHYFENIDYIKSTFNDTIDNETAFFIDKYYGLRKAMKLMQKQYQSNVEELKTIQQQLKDLKHDAKDGLLEEKQFDDYLRLEAENVRTVQGFVSQLQKAYEVSIPMYEEMNPSIDSLIEEDREDQKKAKGVQS
ncbi:MAG: hypothetical protein WD530_07935 [Vicingaceae bacterium]